MSGLASFRFTTSVVVLGAMLGWGAHLGGAADSSGSTATQHWAFQPVQRPPVPTVQQEDWPRNAIDHFVLARQEQAGIAPAPPADPLTRLRRVKLDLTGLPPTTSEVDAFLADPSDEAYRQVVEQLLESAHYGERWARHWLDVARYADSAGQEFDRPRGVWKYRDWVIQKIAEDLPFDEFLFAQLAGDLLPDATLDQKLATGFHCNAIKEYGDHDAATIDRTNAFGTAFLGLTLGCAQCHDHKFDPISQAEYFEIYAFFNQATDTVVDLSDPQTAAQRGALKRQLEYLEREKSDYQKGPDPDPAIWAARLTPEEVRALRSEVRQAIFKVAADRTPEEQDLIEEGHRAAIARFQKALDQRIEQWNKRLSDDERRALSPAAQAYLTTPAESRSQMRPPGLMAKFWEQDKGLAERNQIIAELKSRVPEAVEMLHLAERAQQPTTRVFIRGDHRNLGENVAPNVPDCLPPLEDVEGQPTRVDLAKWVTSPRNPLTARVAVNRIWQRYFGRGLVETSGDFGVQTPAPLHQDLLDWLAAEFMEAGWSMKHIHRLIVTSATYAQSSRERPELADIDPENKLLARQDRIRLEGEIIRDVALAASGLLDRQVGGPSVFPYQPEGIMDGRADQSKWIMSEGTDRYRRGMYTHYWRTTPHPYMKMFDVPDSVESCPRRTRSNTPLQALTLLNDPWFTESAIALARRAVDEHAADQTLNLVTWLFRTCLGRAPTVEEQSVLEGHLAAQREAFAQDPSRAEAVVGGSSSETPAPELAALASVARVVMNLDEFITRE